MSLPTTYEGQVPLAIIGGTGLYKLDGLKPVAELIVDTPWGTPSSPITVAKTASGVAVAFLARHGAHHQFSPSEVPARANIAALKSLGVRAIVAFSAVGSLQAEVKPRDFVLPNQIIDRTKGVRPSTFYGESVVAHATFGDPFDEELRSFIAEVGGPALEESTLHVPTKDKDLTVICMEGPAFSTRAESQMYRSFGGTVINMSVLPEAKLAREAEIAYQMICMSTDYDAWRVGEEPVTVEIVLGHVAANGANAERIAAAVVPPLADKLAADGGFLGGLKGSMAFAMTKPEARQAAALSKLEFLHPGYYS